MEPALEPHRTNPNLPTELWNEIFSYVTPSDSPLPAWELWLKYRLVCRQWKWIVEDYYIRRYLRRTSVVVDCNGSFQAYQFDGFKPRDRDGNGGWDRLAVFRKSTSSKETTTHAYLVLPPQHAYHPNILMHVSSGATDLLPMDLTFTADENGSGSFTFDWRLYLTTLFSELKCSAAITAVHQQNKKQYNIYLDECNREPTQSLVHLACSLYKQPVEEEDDDEPLSPRHTPGTINTSLNSTQTENEASEQDDHALLSPHARAQLILAAGTFDIGCDGRYREVRRQRRRRLWQREQASTAAISNLNINHEDGLARQHRIAFERCDEGRTARKLLMLQAAFAKIGTALEW